MLNVVDISAILDILWQLVLNVVSSRYIRYIIDIFYYLIIIFESTRYNHYWNILVHHNSF